MHSLVSIDKARAGDHIHLDTLHLKSACPTRSSPGMEGVQVMLHHKVTRSQPAVDAQLFTVGYLLGHPAHKLVPLRRCIQDYTHMLQLHGTLSSMCLCSASVKHAPASAVHVLIRLQSLWRCLYCGHRHGHLPSSARMTFSISDPKVLFNTSCRFGGCSCPAQPSRV